VDFQKAYRHCRRAQALSRGVASVKACLEKFNEPFLLVEETSVNAFITIHGYRVTTVDGVAFFPKDFSNVNKNSGAIWMREALGRADIVFPPYTPFGILNRHAAAICSEQTKAGQLARGDKFLEEIYEAESMARLISGVLKDHEAFEQFNDQVVEACKAYHLGLYGVAIVALLPCIEGVVRKLGVMSGIDVGEAVDIPSLLKVFRKLQSQEIDKMFDGYSWIPGSEININLLDKFHERVQMLGNIASYFKEKLYIHTSRLPIGTTLNRHGITHGFFDGYATSHNFLRLFGMLCALSFAAIMVRGHGSLFGPGSSPESLHLSMVFKRCEYARTLLM
jgi:hypothetical protein